MKYLGIDYGDRRVGVALSDDSGCMAFPHKVIENSKKLLDEVLEMVEKEKIETVVVGESLNFKGEPNLVMKNIDKFVAKLKSKTNMPVVLEPEFLTSAQASKLQPRKEMNDASAAALILESYLDRQNNKKV